ncbi:MAG: hypothetical protein CR981_02835 [Proteobacteria bacterium]|nr:MAG: hypothetical protein CR981_02835 [Pseudomonadota bacterium]
MRQLTIYNSYSGKQYVELSTVLLERQCHTVIFSLHARLALNGKNFRIKVVQKEAAIERKPY